MEKEEHNRRFRDIDRDIIKESFKEGLKEWLDEKIKEFGWFSIKTLAALGLGAMIYIIIWAQWHK